MLSAFGQGGLEAATAAVSDALVDKLAIAGDPAYCRDRLGEYASVGLRLPIAYQVLGPDPFLGMELITRESCPDGRNLPRARRRRPTTMIIIPSLTALHSCDAMALAAAPSRLGEP